MPEDNNMKHFNGKTMTASEYYYGVPADSWDTMTYPEAIQDRYQRVQKLYFKLCKLPNVAYDDQVRYHKITKAYNDCKQLVDERSLII